MFFSGWRIYIIYRMYLINILNLTKSSSSKSFKAREVNTYQPKKQNSGRPKIFKKKEEDKHSVRFVNKEEYDL